MATYQTEPRYGIRYPAPGAALPDYETYLKSLATDVGTKTTGYSSGLHNAMPAAGTEGRLYRQTDTGVLMLDNGSVWVAIDSWNYRVNNSGNIAAAEGDLIFNVSAGSYVVIPSAPVSGGEIMVIGNTSPTIITPGNGASNIVLPSGATTTNQITLFSNERVHLVAANGYWWIIGGRGPQVTGVDRGTAVGETNQSGYVDFDVAHNLGVTPTTVQLTPNNFTGFIQVGSKASTQFEVICSVVNADNVINPGGNVTWYGTLAASFDWVAHA